MIKIPISIVFFTSTKEHFGHRDIYLATLNHLHRQIPLESFSVKVAHLKVSSGQEERGEEMKSELEKRGFKVLVTHADWTRGISHQLAYLSDQIKLSKETSLYQNPHVLLLEDDSTMNCHVDDLPKVLHRMVQFVDSSPDILSARFLRSGDFATSPVLKTESDFFWSPHFNFQPAILRSRDFYQILKVAEDNFNSPAVQDCQIEALWRLIMDNFSRSEHKHVVWLPEYASTTHLGVPDFPRIKEEMKL